ncbi:MAG: response regulator transcription factor [Pseudomonadota bacterium]
MRITLVEDNEALRKGITYRLRDSGHAVDALADGDEAEAFLTRESSDLVILDINLPGRSGLDILRGLRAASDARPVILLTARSRTADRVIGLDAGADDYLVKPFEMDELMARVRAVARRRATAPRATLALGALRLDPGALVLSDGESPLDLPRREIAVLAALADAEGRPVSKETILDQVYGAGAEIDAKAVEVYVSRLRKRLAPFGVTIRVERGIGYALELR